MKPPRVLLSDIGGVLVGFRYGTTRRILADLFHTEPDRVVEIIYDSDHFRALERGRQSWENFFRYCDDKLSILVRPPADWSIQRFEQIWLESTTGPIEPMVELWRALKRHLQIASASNIDPVRYARGFQRFHSVADLFDYQTHSCFLGARKGDEDYFPRLLEAVVARAEEALFVDDLAENVELARRAGIRAVHFQGPNEQGMERLRRDLSVAGVPEEWLTKK